MTDNNKPSFKQAKDEVAKKYGFKDWEDYQVFIFHTKTLPSKRAAALDEAAELHAQQLTESQSKEIERLKAELEERNEYYESKWEKLYNSYSKSEARNRELEEACKTFLADGLVFKFIERVQSLLSKEEGK